MAELATRAVKTKNIQSRASDEPRWSNEDVVASLDRLYAHVVEAARRSEEWYWTNKRQKAFWSQWVKWLVVTLTGLAAIIPIALYIWPGLKTLLLPGLDSGLLTSLLMGSAAALLGFDRAWGYSSGWSRYVLTATAIRSATEEFRMDWTLLSSQLAAPAEPDQVSAMIQRAKTFRLSVEALVLKETQDWAMEFQANLAQLEKDLKVKVDQVKAEREQVEQQRAASVAQAAVAALPGALELVVSNAPKADGFRWNVRLENKDNVVTEDIEGSKTWAHIGVARGQYKLTANALINKVPARASALVTIRPGDTTKAELTLAEPIKATSGNDSRQTEAAATPG